jgi:hypothetical protein
MRTASPECIYLALRTVPHRLRPISGDDAPYFKPSGHRGQMDPGPARWFSGLSERRAKPNPPDHGLLATDYGLLATDYGLLAAD